MKKITESELRRMIKESINIDDSRRAIATFHMASAGGTCVVAYDIDALESVVRGTYYHTHRNYNGVISGVILTYADRHSGECNGSFHVRRAASNEKGWGTRVYLAALDYLEIIAADRFSVSPSAEGMWKSLARYGFVQQEPFDDIHNPQTPPTGDDCQVHDDRDPALNAAWRVTGPIPADVKSLMAAGDEHLDALEQEGLRSTATRALGNGFKLLFDTKYGVTMVG